MPDHDRNPYQIPNHSAWMSHWMGNNSDASPQMQNYLTRSNGSMRDDYGSNQHHLRLEIGSSTFGSAKRTREVEGRNNEIVDDSFSVSSKKLRDERVDSQSFPSFRLCQGTGTSSILKNDNDVTSVQELRPNASHKNFSTSLDIVQATLPATGLSSNEFHFQPEGALKVPAQQVKYHMFFGESSYSCLRPNGKITGSESNLNLAPKFESKEHMSEMDLTILGQGHSNYYKKSAFLVSDEKLANMPNREQSINSVTLRNDPSTSQKYSSFGEEEYQNMQNCFGSGFHPSRSIPPEMIKSGNFHYEQCSKQMIPRFVHDVDAMRTCTPLVSAKELAGALPGFSQTTHSLLITRRTDLNLFTENQIFRESSLLTQLEQRTLSELHSTSPLFGHGQGVKLQLLDGSTDSEEKENVKDVKSPGGVQKNETSAETDTMDMELFKQKNSLSGVNSPPSNKDKIAEKESYPEAMEEGKKGKRVIELPDMNVELLALPSASNSADTEDPCSSITQTLDLGALLSQHGQTSHLKANDSPENLPGPEQSSRWIDRLKSNTSHLPAIGTKNSNLSEALSHGKLSKYFSKIMKGACTNREEAKIREHHDEESTEPDYTPKGESPVKPKEDSGDILSHSWIQRWCHNQAPKNPETMATNELQTSNLALAELQRKQFPSIGAMALMGKAMAGFQQCEIQKRDSFVVWNTKSF